MSNVMTLAPNKLPKWITQEDPGDSLNDLKSGLDAMGGMPVLSIRGGKWRLKMGGDEITLMDGDAPKAAINVVILGANTGVAKLYYNKAYSEGDDAAPDCWSVDGTAPAPEVANPPATKCRNCPKNVWGSKITPQGTKTKSCSDQKRLAVISDKELGVADPVIGPILLRVPPASLAKGTFSLRNLMREFERLGAPLQSLVVKMSFDLQTDYPKINFQPVQPLESKELFERAKELSKSELVQRITSTTEEFANEPRDEDAAEADADAPGTETVAEPDTTAIDPFPTEDDETESTADADMDALSAIASGTVEEEVEEKPKPARKKRGGTRKKKVAAKKTAAKQTVEVVDEVEDDADADSDDDAFLGKIQSIKDML